MASVQRLHVVRSALLATLIVLTGCEVIGGFEELEAKSTNAVGGQAGTTAGTGGSSGTSASGGSASGGSGASVSCAGAAGAATAIASAGGDCFGIGAREVSHKQYAEFLASKPNLAGQASICAHNDSFEADCADDGGAPLDDQPVVCVDWCDAAAYCAWAGGALCSGSFQNATDASVSLWFAACAGDGSRLYPYGATPAADACNDADRNGTGCVAGDCEFIASGTLTTCRTPDGVDDLVGNVAEWTDECDAVAGPSDKCLTRGGGVNDQNAQCDTKRAAARDSRSRFTGFRCCYPTSGN